MTRCLTFFGILWCRVARNSLGEVESPVTVATMERRSRLPSLHKSPLEQGSYVEVDPAGPWLSPLEQTFRQNPFDWQNIQYLTDWATDSKLILCFCFDWISQILADWHVFLFRTQELLDSKLKSATVPFCTTGFRALASMKSPPRSLFGHTGPNTCKHLIWPFFLFQPQGRRARYTFLRLDILSLKPLELPLVINYAKNVRDLDKQHISPFGYGFVAVAKGRNLNISICSTVWCVNVSLFNYNQCNNLC